MSHIIYLECNDRIP